MTTYLVTGGAGFIGSHIAERLLRDGHHVRVVDDLSTGYQRNLDALTALQANLEIHRVSINALDALRPLCEGVDVIFHLAALPSVPLSVEDPLNTHEQCATGTLNLLNLARLTGVRRVIYAASSAAYGEVEAPITDETLPTDPISPYGAAKVVGELYASVFAHTYGLETLSLRYFNVFGPRQDPTSTYAAVIPKFITRMLNGQPPIIYGDGTQTRDFTPVENIVHGNLLAAQADDASGQVLNCAMGASISLLELVEAINEILGTAYEPIFEAPRQGDILHSQASIQRAQATLGYAPVLSFADGLARTIDWYRQQAAAGG